MGWFSRHRGSTSADASQREAALFAFSRKLVGAAGVGEIAQALFRAIDDLFAVDECLLLSVSDDQTRAVCVAAMTGMSAELASISVNLEEDASAISQVVRDRAPHRVLDGQRESLHNRQLADTLGLLSAVYVPLQTSSGVTAVAVLATTGRARMFRHDEIDFIQKLANDAAVAIERARLAQTLREVGERELIVAGVARAIRESIEPEELLQTASRELGEQTDADVVRVVMLPAEQFEGRIATWTIEGTIVDSFDDTSLGAGARLAISDHQTVTARAGSDAAAETSVALPLLQRDRLLGVVIIDRPHSAFEPTELRLVELVCVEISAAIEYARLYQGGRKHLDEQLALARAAQSLTADLRFDRVLEHIVEEVVELLQTTSAAFYTYDRDAQILTLRAAFGEIERTAIGETMGLVGLAGRVVQSGVSQMTNDYATELAGEIHPVFEGVQRAISVPVRWQGDIRGVVSVAARDLARRFTRHDIALMEAFADLASLALHNADAYGAHTRQARIQAGFYRISQVLSSSLSRQQTLSALAQAATEALDGDWALVIGGDGADEDLHLEGTWAAPESVVEHTQTLGAFDGSPAELAVAHRRVVTSRTIESDDRLGIRWRELLTTAGARSQLAVPVSVQGRLSAVVVVCFEEQIRFGDEELVVAGNLANAAGAALERASLFENERRTRRLAEVLADVSALLAETLKAQTVLERIVEQAAVLLEVDACSLAVAPPPGPGVAAGSDDAEPTGLIVRAASGRDEPLVRVLQSAFVGGLVEEVARTKRSVTVGELASETSGQALQGESYDAFLGVPLRHPRGHLIGVLSACSRRPRQWSSAEVAALESFGSSAAIAIRNAELYANMKRERDTIETLLASIAEGIVATDAVGRVTLWNAAAEQMTGVLREQVVGRAWRDVLGLDADTVVEVGQSVIEARPAGIPMWLSITSSRLRERGEDAGFIHAFRDVSADHALEQLKSDFVSTVSYVLRTPLTSIYGFANTLLREDVEFSESDRTVFMEYIASESGRLSRIVDDLLHVARIDAGTVEVSVSDCELAQVIHEAVGTVRGPLKDRVVTVDNVDGMRVRADGDKLRTVIGNLLDNAARHSPEGTEVNVAAERENGSVRITVADEGFGIPHGEQKHLFTRFYVAPGDAPGQDGSSGLGLYISKGLVDAMGGRIWVTSQPGAGSAFTIELPTAVEGTTR